ncbi:MAG: maleylacetoacetate isomerase [Deltaproteobacteria bacterium]|nr:maleylacetoacetate isomerase [Deltaproteobacteria bacterium]
MPMTLYHYYRSSCSWRVRWGFAFKKQELNLIPLSLPDHEQEDASYLAKNPSGFVPSLEIGAEYYGESLAILEWLEETVPEPSFFPRKPEERLLVRQLSMTIASGIQPLQNLAVQRFVAREQPERLSWARHWIRRGFSSYETLIMKKSGEYSFRDQLTLADLCLIPQVYNARRFGVEMEEFPKISKIFDNCMKRADCISTAPEQYQPCV